MNAQAEIKRTKIGGDDSIIIKKCIKTLEGGRTVIALDDNTKVFRAGTPIARVVSETLGTLYVSAIVENGGFSFSHLTQKGFTEYNVVGVIVSTTEVKKGEYKNAEGESSEVYFAPCSIMTIGVVNPCVAGIAYDNIDFGGMDGNGALITFEWDEPSKGASVEAPKSEQA